MKKVIVSILITFVILSGMFYIKKQNTISDKVEVYTTEPEISKLFDYITVRGKVIEKMRYNVYSGISGIVTEVYVSVGDNIINGQKLMKVVPIEGEDSKDNLYNEIIYAVSGMLENIVNGSSANCTAKAVSLINIEEDGGCTVLSPCSGTVMSLNCASNENITGTYPCMIVSDLKQLEIKAELDEQYLPQVSEEMRCLAVVNALSGRTFNCRIRDIDPYGKKSISLSGNSGVTTDIVLSIEDNNIEFLRPGYTARINIIIDEKEEAILIPYEAIGQDENNDQYVYVLSNGKLIKTKILTGKELDSKTEVIEGLTGAETIILNPQSVQHGDIVIIK